MNGVIANQHTQEPGVLLSVLAQLLLNQCLTWNFTEVLAGENHQV